MKLGKNLLIYWEKCYAAEKGDMKEQIITVNLRLLVNNYPQNSTGD